VNRLNLPKPTSQLDLYVAQFGRKLDFTAAGELTTILRVPAGMMSTATLQALVSGLPANASFALDIGNNGSTEWSGTVANNSTNSSPDLAAAFNAYWVAQGAPVAGSLDVPVKVTMSQPGQVLLTNLQVTTAGSKQRTLRLNAGAVTQGTLDLALGGSGQQAISVAVDVGADGSLDWTNSVSTTLPVRLTTGNLSTALSSYLTGKSGPVDVPIRIYVAPDVPVVLYDAAVTMQPVVDLAAGGLGVGSVAASGSSATTYLEGDQAPVQATLSNPSSQASGPVTAAFFATAEGWGDWYIGSAFVANIPANGSAPVAILWDTTGFNGVVPVKVVVNPYGRTGETSTSNNTATTQVSITPLNPPPAVDFSATPTLGGAPLSVQFTSVVTNSVTSYAWNFGDGQTSGAANPAHSYTASGVYTVTLTASGPGGIATKRRSSYITVTNTPTPPVAAFSATPVSGVTPLDVVFTNQSTGTITSWQWSFGDGQTSSAANSTHRYTTPGVYAVTLTASGPGGSDVETKVGYIQVSEPVAAPVAAFSATPTAGAAPLAVQFTDQSTGSITGWQWNFGDGTTSTAQSPAHTYNAAGLYTVTLTISGPGGSDVKAKISYIKVYPPPIAPDANFTAIPRTGRAPLAVQFTDASSGDVTSWVWSFGDGATSTARNPSHQYAAVGSYTVALTMIGPHGSDTETKTSYIEVAAAPVAAFSASPTAGAPPLSVLFTDESTGSMTAWTWDFGDGATSTVQHPAHLYETSGVYTVRLTVSGPGGSNSVTKSELIQVSPDVGAVTPTARFTLTPDSGAAPLSVQFTDQSSGTIATWVWSFGDGRSSSAQHPTHLFTDVGIYTITLKVEGAAGSSTKSQQVRVAPALPQFSAAPTTPGGMTIDFTFNPPANVTSWLWDFGDGKSSSEQNPVHTYATAGLYTVRLTVYGANELSSSWERGIEVKQSEPIPPAGFNLYIPTVRR